MDAEHLEFRLCFSHTPIRPHPDPFLCLKSQVFLSSPPHSGISTR